jgi:hypothetical protein
MIEVIDAKHVGDYKIEITFSNLANGVIDFREYLNRKGLFSKLNDYNYFINFIVDRETGTICWDNGLDIAPETLYFKMTGEKPDWMIIS